MSRSQKSSVLALYPFTRGFAFVLFEGNGTPFDWGIKEIRSSNLNAGTMEAIGKLVDRYSPDVMVFRQARGTYVTGRRRLFALYRMILRVARTRGIEVARYTRADIREQFASVGARTKYEIAQAIAAQIPAFAHRMPKPRVCWRNEDPRYSLFDAAALGLTHFAKRAASRETNNRPSGTEDDS